MDGRYRLKAIPGRGLICFFADDSSRAPAAGLDEIEGATTRNGRLRLPTSDTLSPFAMHAFAEIRPDAAAREVTVDLRCRSTPELTLKFVDSDGNPLSRVMVRGTQARLNADYSTGDEIKFRGLAPGEKRIIECKHRGTGLGAVLEVTHDEDQPEQTIVLRPPTILTGRVISSDGEPYALADVRTELTFTGTGLMSQEQTDDSGRFTCLLTAGGTYGLGMRDPFARLVEGLTVATGEKIDLGCGCRSANSKERRDGS